MRVCRKWVIARKIGSITNSSVKGLRCAGAIVVGWSGGEASAGKRIGGWQRKASLVEQVFQVQQVEGW